MPKKGSAPLMSVPGNSQGNLVAVHNLSMSHKSSALHLKAYRRKTEINR